MFKIICLPLLYSFIGLFCLWPGLSCTISKKGPYELSSADYTDIQMKPGSGFRDLRILKRVLKNKPVVLLGEFSHGAKEINLLKNRMIKYLHEKQGYNVLLLESGIGEVFMIDLTRQDWSADQMLKAGLTGPWRTMEYRRLMQYAKLKKGLKLGGIDVQRTGTHFRNIINGLLAEIQVDVERYASLEQRYGELGRIMRNRQNKPNPRMAQTKDSLVNDYQLLLGTVQARRDQLLKRWNDRSLRLICRTIENRIAYLRYYYQFKLDNDYRRRFAVRDSLMAANALWFMEELFPNEKVIISAHNYHVARYNERELVMGEILHQKLGPRMYSIGFFGEQGRYADNSGRPEEMTISEADNDLQNLLKHFKSEASFIHIPSSNEHSARWLYEEVVVNHSFINLEAVNTVNLGRSYDGLVIIKHISPPAYID